MKTVNVPTTPPSLACLARPLVCLVVATLAFGLLGLFPAPVRAQTVGPQIELNVSPAGQRAPAISWDSANDVYVIVWEDRRTPANGTDLYLARISADGTLQDSMGIPVLSSEQLGDEILPAIAYNAASGTHVIAWNEARTSGTAFPEIYVSRFLANTGTILPSAGNLVDGGDGAKSGPDVAAGTVSNLVSFRSQLVGGGQDLRVVRLFPNLDPIDTTPISLASGAQRPSALHLGTEFAVAYEQAGDIFVRSLAHFGATSSVSAAVTVTTATLSQTRVKLGRSRNNGWTAVWQDGRNGPLPVVYARPFSNALAALGSEAAVQTSTAFSQLDPRISGDDNGALVVWQDRRNGTANALIYGARIDSNGTILDPDGFPVMSFAGTAFEQAVVKGPGRDWLVAAVRSDVNTPRVFYRVLRDETPDGPLMVTGPASVPADGASVASLTFGRATGPADVNGNRLTVVDGTLYDLTLSSNAPTIETPDADPNRAGHQVAAFQGDILVELTSTTREMVDVMVASVEGNSSGMTTLSFLNVAPVASNVVIGPEEPRSDEPLALTYDFFDVNGDADVSTTYQWIKNTQVVNTSTLADPTVIPASFTIRSEVWSVRVTPGDGLDQGAPVRSNELIIGNTPPRIRELRLVEAVPDGIVLTGDPLELRFNYRDVDGDSQGPLTEIRWLDNGVDQPDLFNALEIPADRVVKGQSWQVTILPHDTVEFGDLAASNVLTVENTPPTADAGERGTAVLERRRYTLDGTGSSDPDVEGPPRFGYPPDVLTYRWRQVGGPDVELSDTASVTPSFVAPSVPGTAFLDFELVVNDGTVDSEAATVRVRVNAVPDGDEDGLDDEEEETIYFTDPTRADTDTDGPNDFVEIFEYMTDPKDLDSDDDGVRDGREGCASLNCPDPDPAGDVDGDQVINALDPDSDGDGINDGTELGVTEALAGGGAAPYEYLGTDEAAGNFVADEDPLTATDPVDDDTDGDSFLDGAEDGNANGRVDDGESDPNDPLDPGTPCTVGGDECPEPLVCVDGICAEDSTDGPTCTPLANLGLECCTGGCAGGTPATPICRMNGANEQCPVGSDQCLMGSCTGPIDDEPISDEGCSCSANESRRGGAPAWWGLALLLGWRLRRRYS